MNGRRFETAEYYRARAIRMRELASDATAEQAAVLMEAATDFEMVAYLVDAEESENRRK
jgi:hypothetical protein